MGDETYGTCIIIAGSLTEHVSAGDRARFRFRCSRFLAISLSYNEATKMIRQSNKHRRSACLSTGFRPDPLSAPQTP